MRCRNSWAEHCKQQAVQVFHSRFCSSKTNEITGSYPQPLTTLDQLKASPKLHVFAGPSFASDALVISNLKGTLEDVKVRQALSMAIDRKAYINTLYKGYAELPARWPTRAPGALSATSSRPTGTSCPSRR